MMVWVAYESVGLPSITLKCFLKIVVLNFVHF